MKIITKLLILAVMVLGLSLPSFADGNEQQSVNVRSQLLNPNVFHTEGPFEFFGEQFSKLSVESFRDHLEKLKEQDRLREVKGVLFLTAIDMQLESSEENKYQNILKEYGIDKSQLEVRALSVPSKFIKDAQAGMLTRINQRIKHFFPRLKLDYEKPLMSEIKSGLAATVALEIPNVIYLYQKLPVLDSTLVVAAHTATLATYTVYKKAMLNWLLRPGTGNVELFLKQMALSFPFVLNYNLLGNITPIMDYYHSAGLSEFLSQVPYRLSEFMTTQSLSLAMQTLFYSIVVTSAFRSWEGDIEADVLSVAFWKRHQDLYKRLEVVMDMQGGKPAKLFEERDTLAGLSSFEFFANEVEGISVEQARELNKQIKWIKRPVLAKILDRFQAETGFNEKEMNVFDKRFIDRIVKYEEKYGTEAFSPKRLEKFIAKLENEKYTPTKYIVKRTSELSRTVNNWNLVPILAVDAMVVTMMANTGEVIELFGRALELGPMSVNSGHAYITALTIGGYILARKGILDHSIRPWEILERQMFKVKSSVKQAKNFCMNLLIRK